MQDSVERYKCGSCGSIIWENCLQDFYNFLLDSGMDPVSMMATELVRQTSRKRYSRYLDSLRTSPGENGNLGLLMNGAIRKKLGIIPDSVEWGGQSGLVFTYLEGDFMKPRINEVDELLNKGVNVTIYNGQLDVICATKGTEAWVEKLKWGGLKTFLSIDRNPLYCGDEKITKGFTKSYRNLHFYWILEAGHFVPVDQPCIALDMVGSITRSSVSTKHSTNRKKSFIKRVITYIKIRRQASRLTRNSITRDRAGAREGLVVAFFSDNPMYDATRFRKTFQMARPLFNRIVTAVTNYDPFFHNNTYCTGREDISPLIKCTSAIRQLAYDVNGNFLDEYMQISERSSSMALDHFCEAVMEIYGLGFLRKPTVIDIEKLYRHHEEKHGFSGMLGSLDCTDWEWFGCLKS
nr:serine carboxypeptidase-like 51 [Tanacetum cinerariifolium]